MPVAHLSLGAGDINLDFTTPTTQHQQHNTNNTTPTTQHRPSGVRTPPFQCWKGSARSLSSWLDRCSDAKAMKIALIEGAKGKKDRSADAYLQYSCV